jgi:hypothetical protein
MTAKRRRWFHCRSCGSEKLHYARGLCKSCWDRTRGGQPSHCLDYEPSTIHRLKMGRTPTVRIDGEDVLVWEAIRNGVLLRLCNIDLEAERLERLRRVELYRERAGRGEPLEMTT